VPWNQLFILQELDSQLDDLREQQQLGLLLRDERNAHLTPDIARARRETHQIEARLNERRTLRDEAAASLPHELVRYYDRLRQRLRSAPWVVAFTRPLCPACHLVLPSKLYGDAQRSRAPITCPSCARLLVWRDHQPPDIGPW
jgi:predicted  nucleic acid-binding Zn-ribbon protein